MKILVLLLGLLITIPICSQTNDGIDSLKKENEELIEDKKKLEGDKEELKEDKKELKKENTELKTKLKESEESFSFVRLGLSVGFQRLWDFGDQLNNYVDASISPNDSTLKIDARDRSSFVLSAVVLVKPFEKIPISFIANINIANFSKASINVFNGTFNSIEGGIGLAFNCSDDFSLGITVDRVFNRSPRDYIINLKDQKIITNEGVLTSLNKENPNIFRDDNFSAISFKFIYLFSK